MKKMRNAALAILMLAGQVAAAEGHHVIVGYDTSGSMAERYLGPGMHDLIAQAVADTLFGNGFDVAARAHTGPGVIWAEESRQASFAGFPLVREDTLMSFYSFAEEPRIVCRHKQVASAEYPVYPRDKIGGNTNITNAVKAAAWDLLDSAKDAQVYWLLVSDEKNDPEHPFNVYHLDLTQRDLSQLYSLTLHVAEDVYRPLYDKWKAGDAQLQAAFGKEGPPEFVKLLLYKIRDTSWALPPKNLTCSVQEVRKDGAYADLRFQPGEAAPDTAKSTEKANAYRIEQSSDRKTWAKVGDDIAAAGNATYSAVLGPLADGMYYFRVSALQNGRLSQYGAEIPFRVVRIVMGEEPAYLAGKTKLMWDSPKQDDIDIQIEKSLDKGQSWNKIGAVPSIKGEFETDAIKPGDWVRFTALAKDGTSASSHVVVVPGTAAVAVTPKPVRTPLNLFPLLIALLILAAVVAAAVFIYQAKNKKIHCIVEWPERFDDNQNPLSRTFALRPKQRYEFCEPEERDKLLVGQWAELDAPRDYVVHRGDGLYHVRYELPETYTHDAVDEPLQDGSAFVVKTRENREIRLLYTELSARPQIEPVVQQDQEGDRL